MQTESVVVRPNHRFGRNNVSSIRLYSARGSSSTLPNVGYGNVHLEFRPSTPLGTPINMRGGSNEDTQPSVAERTTLAKGEPRVTFQSQSLALLVLRVGIEWRVVRGKCWGVSTPLLHVPLRMLLYSSNLSKHS